VACSKTTILQRLWRDVNHEIANRRPHLGVIAVVYTRTISTCPSNVPGFTFPAPESRSTPEAAHHVFARQRSPLPSVTVGAACRGRPFARRCSWDPRNFQP
jgi:hypothetical protein